MVTTCATCFSITPPPSPPKNCTCPRSVLCHVILRINNIYFPNSINRLVPFNRRQCLVCEIVTECSSISRINIRNSTFLKAVCVSLFCTVLVTHGYSYLPKILQHCLVYFYSTRSVYVCYDLNVEIHIRLIVRSFESPRFNYETSDCDLTLRPQRTKK